MRDALSTRRFAAVLAVILGVAAVSRVAYTVVQARVDPWYAYPILDGRYYLEWATALAQGEGGPPGAFYLAPLYPVLLSLLLRIAGLSFAALYAAQQLLGLLTAAIIAVGGRRVIGDRAALAAAGLFTLYPPLQFFAARPLGETLAILLLIAAVVCAWRNGIPSGFAAGALLGLAALARPNLMLVLPVWLAGSIYRRNWIRAGVLVAGFVLVVSPVTVRNRVASGHWVPISSNGGMTAYHGNGPGARGIYTHPQGFAFEMRSQQQQAVRRARSLSGLDLDPVEADGWWGRRALATRFEQPLESVGLLAWRTALTLDNREWGLDYPPALDPNPLRLTLRLPWGLEIALVPWALVLGLSGAAVVCRGWRRSGDDVVWGAVLATVATPILFYVSTRYRLPTSALLMIPAGVGAFELSRSDLPRETRWRALAVGLALALLSLGVPSGELHRAQLAEDLGNRAHAYLRSGDPLRAEADARRAVEETSDSLRLWTVLGEVRMAMSDFTGAQQAFGRALEIDSAPAASAGLAAALASQGMTGRAIGVLRRGLLLAPDDPACWNRLISLLYAAGDEAAARDAARRALGSGVPLNDEVRAWLEPVTESNP